MASLRVFSGPMASGKTDNLLKELHKFSNVTKEPVLLINFDGDDRTDASHGASTHMYGDSSMTIPLGKNIIPRRVENLMSLSKDYVDKFSVIGIDEAHFYPDLLMFISRTIEDRNKTIYVAGLGYDSDNNDFGQVNLLLPHATVFTKLSAYCSECDPKSFTPAGFTAYDGEKKSAVEIGGLERYRPRCTYHYYSMR